MTATQPEVTATGRYSIQDTATQLGISKRTVERYIEEKKLKAQVRKLNGKKYVTGTEILKVWNQTY